MRSQPIAALLLALVVAWTGGALAEDDEAARELSRRAHGLSRELMSPFCPGRTLADCPSPDAAAVREEIRERMTAGESVEEVRRSLEMRFGDAVRGVPKSVWGWILPTLIVTGGAVVLVFALRRLSRRRGEEPAPRPPPPELARELDEELERRGL